MPSIRNTSIDPVDIPNWRWDPFLTYTIQSLSRFEKKALSIPSDFLDRKVTTGSRSKPVEVAISTWGCSTNHFKKIRAVCLEAGSAASVLNFVAIPFNDFDLPFFGADLVTLPSGHLLALDLQPVLKNDEAHTQKVWERLIPLHDHWQSLLPLGGAIPKEAEPYFSPGFLWTKLPLGKDSDQIIHKVIMPAYIDYFNLYLDLVNESTKISTSRSKILLDGQKSYLSYRAEKDPARNMLTRFYGRKWTEAYINEVLFSL